MARLVSKPALESALQVVGRQAIGGPSILELAVLCVSRCSDPDCSSMEVARRQARCWARLLQTSEQTAGSLLRTRRNGPQGPRLAIRRYAQTRDRAYLLPWSLRPDEHSDDRYKAPAFTQTTGCRAATD